MPTLEHLPKRELIKLAKASEQMRAGLAAGRRRGADVQRLAAALRQQLIAQAVRDLLANPDTARWRTDAIIEYLYKRQQSIGLKHPYSMATFDRRVRREIKKMPMRATGRVMQSFG